MAERYLLLERAGNNKANTSVFEMRLNGKKIHTRFGNKGQKLSKKVFKKSTMSEAIALFSDKRKQKINDGYRIIKEQDKNNLNDLQKNKNKKNPLDQAIPLSGKSIPNPNANNNNKSFSFTFGQKQKNKNKGQSQRDNAKLAEIRQHLAKMNIDAKKQNNEQSDDSSRSGRLKHGNQSYQNRARKNQQNGDRLKPPKNGKKGGGRSKGKNNKNKGKGNKKNKNRKRNNNKNKRNRQNSYNTESSVASSMVSYDDDKENNSSAANELNGNGNSNGNGYHSKTNGHDHEEEEYEEESEFESAMASTEEPDDTLDDDEEDEYETEVEETEDEGEPQRIPDLPNGRKRRTDESDEEEEEEEEDDDEEEEEDEDGSESDSNSSVQSGRSSDDEYEMDYEKMSHVMNDALNKKVDYDSLEWKPLKLWIRFDEYHDLKGEYALAPQLKRIAGSCHELMVVYMRSKSFQQEKNIVYKRLLKLARDPEEDNKHHFETERKVGQYLYRMATMVNNTFPTRNDVCIWPVETIQFEYKGELKWATIQPPFLPDKATNNIFVKIEPNSGKPCVDDPIVGRYQHLFAAITRGLDLIRDWQGYGVSQSVFLDVCNKFNVQKEAVSQIKVRKNKNLQKQTQVLVVIDPVLTTYNAHYETNNPTDFGVKAIDEWKFNHDCIRCRCKYFHLLSANITESNPDGMQFGIADIDQYFFNKDTIKPSAYKEIQKCRYDLNIWFGDDFDQEIEKYHNDDNNKDEFKSNDNDNNDNDNNNDINDSSK